MELKKIHIRDIGRVVTGKTPKTSIADNYGGEIPFLTPSDDLTGKYAPATAKTLTSKGLSEVKNCLLPKNSICVSCIGSDLGKVVLTDSEIVTNQQFNSIIPSDDFDADFVYYLMTIVGRQLNYLSKTSTAVPIINKSSFSSFEVFIPSKQNQKRIAAILSSLDDKISLNNRINHNLEKQAQALYKSWFVDFEPFKDGKFIDSEKGMIPEGWSVKPLGEVTKEMRDKVGTRQDVKVLSPVTSGHLVLSEVFFTKQVFSESIAKYLLVRPGDFAYNPARVNIGSLGINEYHFDGCVSPVYVVFRCEDGYNHFFDLYRATAPFKDEVLSRSSGGVRQTLGYKDFALIRVVYPPKNVVESFNSLYKGIIAVQRSNLKENEILSSQRDALLPLLMSGQLLFADLNY